MSKTTTFAERYGKQMTFASAIATVIGTAYAFVSHPVIPLQFAPVMINQQSTQTTAMPSVGEVNKSFAPIYPPAQVATDKTEAPGRAPCAPLSQRVDAIAREADAYFTHYPTRALDRYRCAESRLPQALRESPQGEEINRVLEAAKPGNDSVNPEVLIRVRQLFSNILAQYTTR